MGGPWGKGAAVGGRGRGGGPARMSGRGGLKGGFNGY